MVCALSRWMISRAEDTGKRPPRWVASHVRGCAACGEFARRSASLASRLRTERAAWLAEAPEFPAGRALDLEPAGTGRRAAGSGEDPARRFRFLRPLPAAAAALVLVAAGIVVLLVARREPGGPARNPEAARAAFRQLASAPGDIRRVLNETESPLDKERRALEELVASAADYLGNRLNVKIERKARGQNL